MNRGGPPDREPGRKHRKVVVKKMRKEKTLPPFLRSRSLKSRGAFLEKNGRPSPGLKKGQKSTKKRGKGSDQIPATFLMRAIVQGPFATERKG